MADQSVCSDETLYSSLSPAVISHGKKLGIQPQSAKKGDVVKSFLQRHLPAARLVDRRDDLTNSLISISSSTLKKKKKKFDLSVRKRKKITNKERKTMKVFDISEKDQSYSQHLVLHEAWKQYMEELIPSSSVGSPGAAHAACQKLMKAELQGGMLTVQRSKCPSYLGVRGIVLQETRNTFTFITPDDRVKRVPKENNVFAVELSGHLFTIHGNHFKVKAGERTAKKFKSKPTTDL